MHVLGLFTLELLGHSKPQVKGILGHLASVFILLIIYARLTINPGQLHVAVLDYLYIKFPVPQMYQITECPVCYTVYFLFINR